jgi:hypothetical protein
MNIPRLIGASVLVLSIGAVACDDDDPTSPELPTSFTTELSGEQERPNQVDSDATGTATFTVTANGNITYSVRIANFPNNVTACHIHAGASDASGNILVNLCPAGVPGPITALTEIASGTISHGINSNLVGSNPISMATLRALMAADEVYVNVHSNAFGGGEIRGSVFTSP